MGAKYTTKVNLLDDMKKSVSQLSGRAVDVGCLEGEHAWLAAIHEYGCEITVTPKMRAFLHHQGIHLKASTTKIVIPERSFIRAGYDDRRNGVLKYTDQLLSDVVEGNISVEAFLKTVGLFLSSEIKEYATDLSSPKNSPMTVRLKGSSNPLMDTGQMIGGITYEVK